MTSILLHFTTNVSISIDGLTKKERPLKGAFHYDIHTLEDLDNYSEIANRKTQTDLYKAFEQYKCNISTIISIHSKFHNLPSYIIYQKTIPVNGYTKKL